jgi:deoxyribodipyrimidine photo-lyase
MVNIFWFRRDLRLEDNAGLYHSLKTKLKVKLIFVFDAEILDKLTDKDDARVTFIYDVIQNLKNKLNDLGKDINVYYGKPLEVWKEIIATHKVAKVFTNHDFEEYAKKRDESISALLSVHGVEFKTFKDHVIFEKDEVIKDDGKPYTVFTPYKRKWLAKLTERREKVLDSFYFKSYPSEQLLAQAEDVKTPSVLLTLDSMGFSRSTKSIPAMTVTQGLISKYDETRNFPAISGTSRLGIHFRFGTISIREKARKAAQLNETFLSELIWRDFYAMILYHFPHVANSAFRPEYDQIQWRTDEKDFDAWCQGKTGYPIVDAGMRELLATGHMHNRVRMIVASFLTKHLLIDWRWGEAWFARHLLDFDLASNNGGWQWAAGCGTDAAPYFRIFSPDAQTDKFDKHKVYIKRWVPEYGTANYPKPIVDHKFARERCLEVYKSGLAR